MLKVEKLTKYYGQHLGLKELSFSLAPGDVIGILGPNGSGKTTLFRLLLGLIPATSGEIIIPSTKSKSQYFGYLPEERSVYRDISVYDQITYLARLKKMNQKKIDRETDYWLKKFNLLEQKHKLIRQLSKGNQQKVQFICALIHHPSVLILDEPLTGLDAQNVSLFKEVIIEQSKRGKCILLSSHQYEELETFCHQIVLLQKGETKLQGKLEDLKLTDGRVNVTIDQDSECQYQNLEGLTRVKQEGHYTLYTFKNRNFADNMIRQVSSNTLRIEPIGLRDLVEEVA